jgi:hypothetical protein
VHTGTDISGRTKPGSDWFHHTAPGPASTTTGGKSYSCLTDATGLPRTTPTPTPTASSPLSL